MPALQNRLLGVVLTLALVTKRLLAPLVAVLTSRPSKATKMGWWGASLLRLAPLAVLPALAVAAVPQLAIEAEVVPVVRQWPWVVPSHALLPVTRLRAALSVAVPVAELVWGVAVPLAAA